MNGSRRFVGSNENVIITQEFEIEVLQIHYLSFWHNSIGLCFLTRQFFQTVVTQFSDFGPQQAQTQKDQKTTASSKGLQEELVQEDIIRKNRNRSQTDQKSTLKGLQNDLKRTYKDLEALSGP